MKKYNGNYNSIKNQEIKAKFVGQNVIHDAGEMVWELQNNEQFRDEIFEKFYSTPDWEFMADICTNNIDKIDLKTLKTHFDVENVNEIDSEDLWNYCDRVFSGVAEEYYYLEPYEFWIVDSWFGDKLKEKGEIVADFLGFTIWGRCTSGQAILLDGVISRICEDLEILEGQENEWNV